MEYTTLISAGDLSARVGDPSWAIFDCRFSLDDPLRGWRAYQQAHIPGAVYAHLEEHLSGTIQPGMTGRHPLPEVAVFAEQLSAWGIDSAVRVVAYDDSGGSMAARLWWMLHWLGHPVAAVLDGGWQRWLLEGGATQGGEEKRSMRRFTPHPRPDLLATSADVVRRMHDPSWRIVDSRAKERYRGEVEPFDAVAGRIPGAVNLPHTEVVGADGLFLESRSLAQHFRHIIGETPGNQAVFYCGSGVTAAHNLLAMAYAGLGEGQLYAGSWSEWITDPNRPVERD